MHRREAFHEALRIVRRLVRSTALIGNQHGNAAALGVAPAQPIWKPDTTLLSDFRAHLFSGGYVASGTGTPDRLPSPFRPAGLRLTKTEGAGEVQTPVLGAAADELTIGDRVWMRHAKGGELAERITAYHLISPGESDAVSVPTYRGDGQCFG